MANELINYIYISRTKVEMLYSQLKEKLIDKYNLDLTINTPFLKIDAKSNEKENELKVLIKKLNNIVNYLGDENLIGTVDEPKSFFSSTNPLSMKWGFLPMPGEDATTIYFSGSTKNTIIGLGGSKKHILSMDMRELGPSASHIPLLINSLKEAQRILLKEKKHPQSSFLKIDNAALAAVQEIDRNWEAPVSKLDFLALNLMKGNIQLRDESGRKNVVLGSPLYVAYAKD